MNRGSTITIVAVLALTSGVVAAAAVCVSAYLWRALPYAESGRLAVADYPRGQGPSVRELSGVDATAVAAFAELSVASDPDAFTIVGGPAPFMTEGRWIGADVFTMFGVRPVLGRAFTRAEADSGQPVAMLGYEVWRDRFGSSPDVIGRSISVRATLRRGTAETFTIVGVLPRRFWHIDDTTGILVPLSGARAPWLMRLRDGVSRDEAARRLTTLVRGQVASVPGEWEVLVQTAHDAHIARVRPMLTATTWGVMLLAGVTLASLAFLQMARGVGRQREIAVRTALGAGRPDVLRLFMREGLIHGTAASIIACALAFTILTAGIAAIEQYVGRVVPGTPAADPRIYALLIAFTTTASIALSMIALLASRSVGLATALAGAATMTDTPARLVIRQAIVAAQVAVAFCLLVGAALMVRTAWHIGHVDPGFDPRNVLSANLTLHQGTYRTIEEQRRFFAALTDRLRHLRGVEQAGLTGWLPFRVGPAVTVIPEGGDAGRVASGVLQGVDPGYFASLRIRVQEGRVISADDRAGRANAAVISVSMARELWSGQSPLGRAFRIKFSQEPGRGFGPYTVVGVVDDVMQSVMRETPPQLYLSFAQQPIASNAFLQLRTRGNPRDVAPDVERVIREMDPNLALASITTLEDLIAGDGLRPRLLARALAGVASLAMAIAVIGLYAVSAWIAHLRRREVALRIALGSDRVSVAALLARRGLLAVAAGLSIGWIAAWPLVRVIASEVRGLSADDMTSRLAVAALLGVISIGALLTPAWRASTGNLAGLLRDL
jgi:predicted permease